VVELSHDVLTGSSQQLLTQLFLPGEVMRDLETPVSSLAQGGLCLMELLILDWFLACQSLQFILELPNVALLLLTKEGVILRELVGFVGGTAQRRWVYDLVTVAIAEDVARVAALHRLKMQSNKYNPTKNSLILPLPYALSSFIAMEVMPVIVNKI
jgi:hypothetical protein